MRTVKKLQDTSKYKIWEILSVRIETGLGHRHAMYINIPFSTLMYIACLCPNLVSVHFYAIPMLHFKFPKFLYKTYM